MKCVRGHTLRSLGLVLPCLAACASRTAQRHAGPRASAAVPTIAVRAPYTPAQLAEVVDFHELAIAPDGSEVAFVTDRSGSFELWTVALREGVPGQPRQRTHASEDVSGPVYSPDGSLLLFEMDHGGDERTDLWMLRRGTDTPEQLTATQFAERGVEFSPDGRTIAFERDSDRPFRFNVHTMDLATRAVVQQTHEPVNVQTLHWSPDGRTLVATRSGDDQRGDLAVIEIAAQRPRFIAAPQANGILFAAGFAASDSMLAVATNAAGFMQLASVDLATGRARYSGPSDWDVERADIADDGTVVTSRNVHGQNEVTVYTATEFGNGHGRVVLREGVVTDIDLSRRAHTVALLRETSHQPTELLAVDTRSGRVTTVIAAEVAGVRVDQLGRAERREIHSFDDRAIDVFVTRPPISRLGSPPPAVVVVHGGPNGQTRGAFSPLTQSLAEAGFVVIAPNYRGSTGYGRAFEDLNNRDWGGGDLRDLVTIVGTLVDSGEIDRARVGITGGSYGGYMTLRAITAAPTMWAAAVEGFGMPDLEEDYRITADRFGSWYQTEMGDPVRDRALYRDRSPVHSLDRVRAPLLVLQGANDSNVPRIESDRVVEALRARHARVEYKVYPNEGHGFTHRDNRIDAMTRTVEFFVREMH